MGCSLGGKCQRCLNETVYVGPEGERTCIHCGHRHVPVIWCQLWVIVSEREALVGGGSVPSVPIDRLAQCRPFAVNFKTGHGDGVFKEGRRVDLYRLIVIVQRFWV